MCSKKENEVLGFVGTGRVGRALASLFHRRDFEISTVVDVDLEKARMCQNACKAWASACDVREVSPKTTMLFIAVPDDRIESVGLTLAETKVVQPGIVVAHTSGLLTSDVLSPIRREGVSICSFHPCFSFIEAFEGDLEDVLIAIEGNAEGRRRLEILAGAIGGRPVSISKEDKVLYHAGCTMASNYLVALMHLVQRTLRGIGEEEGFRRVLPLVHGTMKNIERVGVEHALTGPVVRGDIQTVEKHLKALSVLDPCLIPPYITLGRVTLRMAERSGLEPDKISSMEDIFIQYEGVE